MRSHIATIDAAFVAAQAGQPVLIEGPPGVGKSTAIEKGARSLGWRCETFIGSQHEPTDFSGLPVRGTAGMEFEAFSWAHRIVEADSRGTSTLLFLDEITNCSPATQSAMLRVVREKMIGNVRLPESTRIIAAANPPSQASNGYDLSAPMANRFVHLSWESDVDAWCTGLLSGWTDRAVPQLPARWIERLPAAKGIIAAFIRRRPMLMHHCPEGGAASRSWPSPRTWESAANLLAAANSIDPDGNLALSLVSGAVGEGAAFELFKWMADAELPDPREALDDPASLDLPMRPDLLHAVTGSVIALVRSSQSVDVWTRAWRFLRHLAVHGHLDIATFEARHLVACRRADWPLPTAVDTFRPVLERAGLLQ